MTADSKHPPVLDESDYSITVVVVAFNRRHFLLEAVRSVLSQTLPRSEFEVLVIKNFLDQKIDQYLADRGVRSILFGSVVYGETIARALKECGGRIIMFLEDDDLFESAKLATVQNAFAKSEDRLVLYHDDYIIVNEWGIPIPPSPLREWADRRFRSRGRVILRERNKQEDLPLAAGLNAEAHLSCIAVRRDLLIPVRSYLEQVPVGVDFFVFYAALSCDGAILVEPRKLTRYRRHPDNSSRDTVWNEARFEGFVEGSRTMARVTRDMVRSMASPWLLQTLEEHLRMHELFIAFARDGANRRALASRLIDALRHRESFAWRSERSLAILTPIYLVHPRLARRILQRIRG